MVKISVIIPVYNVEKYLRECLDSIINQTFKDIEIICVDDGSTDNSLKILEEYAKKDDRFVIISQKNQGVSIARNNGMERATGEYLYFLDSDDWIDKNLLEVCYQKSIDTNCDIVCFGYKEHRNNKILDGYSTSVLAEYDNSYLALDALPNFIHLIWDKFYRKEFIKKHAIKFPEHIKTCEDGYFNMQCLIYEAKWLAFAKSLYHYRSDRPNSAMNCKSNSVLSDIECFKVFTQSECFINASYAHQKICIEKMINGILSLLKKSKSIYYSLKYIYHIQKLKQYILKNLNKDLIANSNAYKDLNKITLLKFICQNIFSVKNEIANFSKRKVITILFCKIKIKNSKNIKEILSNKVTHNSVLLIEANNCHNETLPSFAKYFTELGFIVDILVTDNMYSENVFSCIDHKYYHKIFHLDINQMQEFLSSNKPSEYKYIFINSNRLYYCGTTKNPTRFFEFFHHITSPQCGFIKLEHHLEFLNQERLFENKILQLPNFNNGALFCNACYFGEIPNHNKNKIVNFIAIGAFKDYRRNINLLFDAVETLDRNNIHNFKITILSRSFTQIIPEQIRQYFIVKKNLPFDKLYNEITNADFFLPCLNPDNESHDRYIKTGTSGSFQLIYGFNIPCIIEEKFVSKHYLNNTNSIVFQGNENFVKALNYGISMSNDKYQDIKSKLHETTKFIQETSIKNLQHCINSKSYKIVSLGCDCLPRTYTTNSGLKATKTQGEVSMAFDLCVTPTPSLLNILKNNFIDYLKHLKYSKSQQYWINDKYNILYNHDADCLNNSKGKKKIIKRLKSRILNFKTTLNYDGMVYFIINNPTTEDLANKIYDEIKRKRLDKPFKFFIIDMDAKLNCKKLYNDILVFNLKHPFDNASDWWLEKNITKSKEYEKLVAAFIKKELNEQTFKICQ